MRYLASVILCCVASAQSSKISVTVERREGQDWKAAPSGLVFKKNDHLRFRVRTNFDGYLYVMNYGTSGQYTKLFPREETGTQNKVKAGVDYFVPATEASFRIDGPPGFDVIYWMVSPLNLGDGGSYVPLPPPPSNPVPQNLKPRCDESILRARSICIDSSAGPKSITEDEKLPQNLSPIPHGRSRDVVISTQGSSTSISSPEKLDGPVIYKFLVAHE